jgi:DNA (cytosine-5)-methyltransferase 1
MDGVVALPEGDGVEAGSAEGLALFPPSPLDFEGWERVLAGRPDLQPALFGVEHGLAGRLERSFVCGNGVVPLAAAFAYLTLVDVLARGD